jgi:guanylate kinase
MKSKNTLFIISAPSGAGKTTIMRKAMGSKVETLSYTTRIIRENEKDGVDYHFISKERFEEIDKTGDMIEKTKYPPNDPNGNFYGVSWDEVKKKLNKGDAYIIVDSNGMEQLKAIHDNCVTIWIYTSKEDAIANMLARGDSQHNVRERMKTFDLEQTHRTKYDYVITNEYGKIKDTIKIIKAIVKAKGTKKHGKRNSK